MSTDPVLERICLELVTQEGAHTVLVYGSRADGTAGQDSDYDVAAFAPIAEPRRIARLEGGTYLDIFIYPEAVLLDPGEDQLRLRSSRVLMQRDSQADAFLLALDELHRRGPVPLPADEIAARRVWARKMLARTQRGDPEGNYRRAWLLQALLEDYFHVRHAWYEGPKKSLALLAGSDPVTYQAFCAALAPGASPATLASLVDRVVGPADVVDAAAEDADRIRAFMAHVIRTSVTTDEKLFSETAGNVDRNVAIWLAEPQRCIHLVAMREGELVGVVLVKDFWNLCSLFVSPALQGSGIGRLLVESAANRCRGRSPKGALWLNAATDAVAFYQRLGFVARESAQPLPPGFKAMQRPL